MGSVVRVYPGPPFLVLTLLSILWIDAPDGPANDGRRTVVLYWRSDRRFVQGGRIAWVEFDRATMVLMNGLWLISVGLSCSQGIGALAQLGEHLLCKQGVNGSIPLSSTIYCPDAVAANAAALRTGRRTIGDGLWPVLVPRASLSSEENTSLHIALSNVPVLQKS